MFNPALPHLAYGAVLPWGYHHGAPPSDTRFVTPSGRPHGVWTAQDVQQHYLAGTVSSNSVEARVAVHPHPSSGVIFGTDASVEKSALAATRPDGEANIVACVISNRADEVGVALCDLNSLRISLTQIADTPSFSKTVAHLSAVNPIEVALPHNLAASRVATALVNALPTTSFVLIPRRCFNDTVGVTCLLQLLSTGKVGDVTAEIQDPQRYLCCASASALIARVEQRQNCSLIPGTVRVSYVALAKHVEIDRSAIAALQLLAPPRANRGQNVSNKASRPPPFSANNVGSAAKAPITLSEAIDTTVTRMGQRLLRSNLLQPISHLPTLNLRYDAVGILLDRMTTAALPLKSHLQSFETCDIDAVLGVFARVPSGAPTLSHLMQTIQALVSIRRFLIALQLLLRTLQADSHQGAALGEHDAPQALLQDRTGPRLRDECELLDSIASSFECVDSEALVAHLDRFIDPAMTNPNSEHAGAFKQSVGKQVQICFTIRDGLDAELDNARKNYSVSIEAIVEHAEELKRRFNLTTLRLVFEPRRGFHFALEAREASLLDADVFGHIALPNSTNAQKSQSAKMTCTTRALQRLAAESQEAMGAVLIAQHACLEPLLSVIRESMGQLHTASEAVALLDVLLSHVTIASRGFNTVGAPAPAAPFVRPTVQAYGSFHVVEGRPLCLQPLPGQQPPAPQTFALDGSSRTFVVLTGPNGSGKTTLLRSVAHWALLAHVGAYVPAARASIPLLEGICTRFSASDVAEAGASSFFRDMSDLGHVVRVARRRFLVLLDEIGRGTSTAEGCSIAWAVAERLADVRCLTIFSTHFMPLTHLPQHLSNCCNMHLRAVAIARGLSFEYEVTDGECTIEHYGLTLASMLGMPPEIMQLATHNVALLCPPQHHLVVPT